MSFGALFIKLSINNISPGKRFSNTYLTASSYFFGQLYVPDKTACKVPDLINAVKVVTATPKASANSLICCLSFASAILLNLSFRKSITCEYGVRFSLLRIFSKSSRVIAQTFLELILSGEVIVSKGPLFHSLFSTSVAKENNSFFVDSTISFRSLVSEATDQLSRFFSPLSGVGISLIINK
jgi:hypothetical protein